MNVLSSTKHLVFSMLLVTVTLSKAETIQLSTWKLQGGMLSVSTVEYSHLLSPRTHGRQDLVVTTDEPLFSEDTYKIHGGRKMRRVRS